MADISRYRGGAQARKTRVSKQIAGSRASAATERRVADTRAVLDSPPSEDNAASPRRVLNIDTTGRGEMVDQLPLPYAADQADSAQRSRTESEADKDGFRLGSSSRRAVSYRRRFKSGGRVKG